MSDEHLWERTRNDVFSYYCERCGDATDDRGDTLFPCKTVDELRTELTKIKKERDDLRRAPYDSVLVAFKKDEARITELEDALDDKYCKALAEKGINKIEYRLSTALEENKRMMQAIKDIRNCLGPVVPNCGCEGCEVEMQEALDIAGKFFPSPADTEGT